MKNPTTSNLALVDKPQAHDIEAVRPHLRKHMRAHKLLINGSEVTIQGKNSAEAAKRFHAMTGGAVGFVMAPLTGRGIRKGELTTIVSGRRCGKSAYVAALKNGMR